MERTYRMGLDPRRRGGGGGGSNDRLLGLLVRFAGNHGRRVAKARTMIIVLQHRRGRSSFVVVQEGFGFGHVTSIAFERRGTRIVVVTRQPERGATDRHDGSRCCRRRP
jgi:hypothetical protein